MWDVQNVSTTGDTEELTSTERLERKESGTHTLVDPSSPYSKSGLLY